MDRRGFISKAATGVLALASTARAQQSASRVIGFLGVATPAAWAPFVASFRAGLNETGYTEGRNVRIEFRWAEGQFDRLPALAADLVSRRVDVIVATGGARAARAAEGATSTIPIVFTTGTDPVEEGIVASLARPGGNTTGVGSFTAELAPKRLELLRELLPTAQLIAWIVNPAGTGESQVRIAQAAHVSAQQLQIFRASTPAEIDAVFASFTQRRPDALVVGTDPYFRSRREQFVALAARYGVPAVYEGREAVVAGGLLSYGPSLVDVYRQAGIYAGKVLSGAKPADLPIQQPTKFELVINLKTARALGLTIPQSLLLRADEIIE